MAYQTGTSSSMHDLLDKLRLFLSGNGWTVDQWTAGDGWLGYLNYPARNATGTSRLHVHKTDAYGGTMRFNFRSATSLAIQEDYFNTQQTLVARSDGLTRYQAEVRGIGVNGSTGYDGGVNWDQQPGSPEAGATGKSVCGCITEVPNSGNFNYWIFQNSDCTVLVVEIASGVFQYLAFGCLVKAGAYAGGMFYAASCGGYAPTYWYWNDNPAVRVLPFAVTTSNNGSCAAYIQGGWKHSSECEGSFDTNVIRLWPGACPPWWTTTNDYASGANLSTKFIYLTPNTFNGAVPMVPLHHFILNINGRYQCVGYPTGIRAINCSNYNPADEFTIGGDTWKVFPAHTKVSDIQPTPAEFNGYRVGFALLKTV